MTIYQRAKEFVDAQLAIDKKHGAKPPKLSPEEYDRLIRAVVRATPPSRKKRAA